MLDVTAARVRQLAPTLGHKVDGRWVLERRAVERHRQQTRSD